MWLLHTFVSNASFFRSSPLTSHPYESDKISLIRLVPRKSPSDSKLLLFKKKGSGWAAICLDGLDWKREHATKEQLVQSSLQQSRSGQSLHSYNGKLNQTGRTWPQSWAITKSYKGDAKCLQYRRFSLLFEFIVFIVFFWCFFATLFSKFRKNTGPGHTHKHTHSGQQGGGAAAFQIRCLGRFGAVSVSTNGGDHTHTQTLLSSDILIRTTSKQERGPPGPCRHGACPTALPSLCARGCESVRSTI